MPFLLTEVVDRRCCAPKQAGAFDFLLTVDPLELLPRGGLPEAPPLGSDADTWEAYFAALAARTTAMREKRDKAVQADVEHKADWLESYGEYGKAAAAIYRFAARVGFAIAKWMYKNPDWNDPKWTAAALATLERLHADGWQGFGPYTGPDRASTEDAIDWAESLAEAEARFHTFVEDHPDEALRIASAFDWANAHPDHPAIADLRQAELYPVPLGKGSIPTDEQIAALARVLAVAQGKELRPILDAGLRRSAEVLDKARDERGPDGEPLRYSGNKHATGEVYAALARAADRAPDAPVFLAVLPTGAGSAAFTSGDPFSSPTTGTTSTQGASGGGGGAGAAVVGLGLAALLMGAL